jgi:hypothetical protein
VDVDCNLLGKKSRNQQEQFDKILYKQCPMHLKSKHTLFMCINLRKFLNLPLPNQDAKRKDKENDEGDKLEAQGFQHPANVVNVIFGGDFGFPTKPVQKLTLHKIMAIEPAKQHPLRYSEVPISFSREV